MLARSSTLRRVLLCSLLLCSLLLGALPLACAPSLESRGEGGAGPDEPAYFGPALSSGSGGGGSGGQNPWLASGGGDGGPSLGGGQGSGGLDAGSGGALPRVDAQVLITRYHETPRGAKYLELELVAGTPPLAGQCTLDLFTNGRTSAYRHVSLPALSERLVACTASNPPATDCVPALGSALFNGNDALVIRCGGAITDSFGQVGFDPGVAWVSGEISTRDQSLVRCSRGGDTDPFDAFDPALDWVTQRTGETTEEARERCSSSGAGGAGP